MQLQSRAKSHSMSLYLGSINETTKIEFSYEELVRAISSFQDRTLHYLPVRISKTEFISGSQYREAGWEIFIINFPKFKYGIKHMEGFMMDLATALLDMFQQKKICIVGPKKTLMIDRSNNE